MGMVMFIGDLVFCTVILSPLPLYNSTPITFPYLFIAQTHTSMMTGVKISLTYHGSAVQQMGSVVMI